MLWEFRRMWGDASDGIVPPAESRRRARLRGGAILACLTVIAAAPSLPDLDRHREPGGIAIGFASFATLLIAVLPQLMANSPWSAWRLRGARGDVLAARTMTGWRTVDLMRIRRVHLCSLPGRYGTGSGSYLVVVDANGSRIGSRSTDQAAVRWIRDAIRASRSTGVRASRGALISLEIPEREYHRHPPCRDAHPMLGTLAAWLVLITVYSGAVALFLR